MAETPLESDQPENQGLPIPEFSENGGSSTSSGADDIVGKLLPQLEQLIEKKMQSQKDKRIDRIEKALGGRDKILAELEADGVNIPKEVRTQMQIRELQDQLAQRSTQPAQPPVDGSTGQRAAVSDAIAELKKHELDTNDADFIALLRGKYNNRAEFDLAVSRHVVKKLTPQKPANPADVVQSPASGGITEKSAEALTDEYKQKMRAARGNKSLLTSTREAYLQKGVKVWEIDFS